MTIKLDSKIRTLTGKKTEEVRDAGKIPAVIYGHGVKNKNLELDYNTFDKVFKEAGESTIIDLNVDGETVKVVVSAVQYEAVKDTYRHVDFHQIRMDEKLTANIELKFVGEPKAVKDLGGILVHNISEVEIKCLPADLINEIEVDVSGLDNFGDSVVFSELKVSDKIEILGHDENDVVAMVSEPREEIEEEVEAPAEAGAEGETKDGEAGAEGEKKEGAEGEGKEQSKKE